MSARGRVFWIVEHLEARVLLLFLLIAMPNPLDGVREELGFGVADSVA